MLCHAHGKEGFKFFTSYDSQKGDELVMYHYYIQSADHQNVTLVAKQTQMYTKTLSIIA